MSDILNVQNLTKIFGQRIVIDNLSFHVPAEASLAITGPSGCGKSTLLNIIGMLEAPTHGSIMLEDKPLPAINSTAATKLRRKQINYLFQSYALISDLTAHDNAMLGLHYAPISKEEKTARINEILAKLGLYHVKDERVSTLSGGEQQRLALARCILKPGNLILADEPTGALDRKLSGRVLEQMLELQHEHHKTLIIVTHDPHVAKECNYVMQLNGSEDERE
ncbi:ABC transporter ATP-binding protein [Schaalia sp. lx-260]|uniref:ABC transporter ATP-binding protein n=1 Tax=Schaalia sp. lx-260 TaxID=2899082 RepID=UPI001E4946EB|nr:ABC transporter ATP-binding protein [Schaalia sp. lx-260]MCD4549594.1 ABC transporter ATP-binding protein [Schaalia sp. lx-260]